MRFLDDQTTTTFQADLTTITRHSTQLLLIARRETSPPGGRAARNPNGFSSTPPLNVGALSISEAIHESLLGWSRLLRVDDHTPLPHQRDTPTLATHLHRHTQQVAHRPWALACAIEVGHWAATILTVTDPPPPKLLADYTPAQRREGMTHAKVDAPTCALLVAEWTKGEHTPTADMIRNWGKREHVTRFGPQPGKGVYSPREVIAHMSSTV